MVAKAVTVRSLRFVFALVTLQPVEMFPFATKPGAIKKIYLHWVLCLYGVVGIDFHGVPFNLSNSALGHLSQYECEMVTESSTSS